MRFWIWFKEYFCNIIERQYLSWLTTIQASNSLTLRKNIRKKLEKLDGKILNPSAVSKARYELGLPNRYRGHRKKLTYEYWIKVVDFLGRKNNVAKSIIKKARTNRSCFHWWFLMQRLLKFFQRYTNNYPFVKLSRIGW